MTAISQWARSSKRNTVMFGAIAWGVPMWFLEIWITWDFSHAFLWIVFLGVVALGGGLLWGWGMWHAIRLIYSSNKNPPESTRQ